MVDITYLFEEGAHVDFKIDGLVKLVMTLFSDMLLRAETIQKLHISKCDSVLFTYCSYSILFAQAPRHLDTQNYVSFGPGLYND